MDILTVAAELGPYVRQTEAADVIASLAKALRQLGHDVTVALPRHPGFEASGLLVARRLTPLPLPGGGEVTVFDGQLPSGVRVVLFDAPVLFERSGVYGEGDEDYPDNAKRFGLLSRAAAALVRQRAEQGQAFDVLHLHDWPAALVPHEMRRAPGPSVPSVLTIHDVTRQGSFAVREHEALGLPRELADDEGLMVAGKLNVLMAGITYADAITTVSPTYAEELVREDRAGALARPLASAGKAVIGITNGIDYSYANPATDPALISRYDAEDFSNKGRSKAALARELGLEIETERPLFVCVGPLTRDKGADLLASALPSLLKNDLTLLVAGRGSDAIVSKLESLRDGYEDRYALVRAPDQAFLHRAFARSSAPYNLPRSTLANQLTCNRLNNLCNHDQSRLRICSFWGRDTENSAGLEWGRYQAWADAGLYPHRADRRGRHHRDSGRIGDSEIHLCR